VIIDVGDKVGRIVKINVFIVITIEKVSKTANPTRQIVPAAQGNDPAEETGVAHGDVYGMIGTHAATMGDQCGVGIFVVSKGNDFFKNVIFILFVPGEPVAGRTPVTVEALGIDAIDAADLEPAFINFIPQGRDKAPVFVIDLPARIGNTITLVPLRPNRSSSMSRPRCGLCQL
jgi:hypothetical protein